MSAKENQIHRNTLKEENKAGAKKTIKKKPKDRPSFWIVFKDIRLHFSVGLFLQLLSIYLAFAFTSFFQSYFYGPTDIGIDKLTFYDIVFNESLQIQNWGGRLGAAISWQFIHQGFGVASYLILFFVCIAGIKLAFKVKAFPIWRTLRLTLILLLWVSLAMGFLFHDKELSILAGVFGVYGIRYLIGFMGELGTGFLLLFVILTFLIFTINISIQSILARRKKKTTSEGNESEEEEWTIVAGKNALKEDKYNTTEFAVDENEQPTWDLWQKSQPVDKESETKKQEHTTPIKPLKPQPEVEFTIEQTADEKSIPKEENKHSQPKHFTIDTPYDPTLDLSSYVFPTLELLDEAEEQGTKVNKDELEENKNRIVQTLSNYSIQIEKIKATIGPAVTLYEIIPAPGVRISRIKNLEDDIALSLSALGIRIIAPIPGKGTIGIEVPNQNPEIVTMKSILSSEKFQLGKYELPFGMGKTISNESFVVDLTKLPHILMAGATGQGKSVGLNAIITSLLYKKHPAQVKFVMIDPKKVELTLYSKIERHFLAKLPDSEEAIITDTRKVVRTLNSLNIEMDSRYDLLKDAQVRNIKEYNTKFIARQLNPLDGHRFLPYIIVVIDEFADLIMTAGKEIEVPLTRLAQLARAIGIHLIIATQRPSVNIITGSIKANFPARFAFRVISKIDSRTILDTSGAEQLIGRGDMLLSTGSDLLRLQCAFIDTHEIERITDFIGSQRGYPDAFYLPEYYDEEGPAGETFDPSERDELFEDAAHMIVAHQQGSTSLLQRKLKLGYNRAGRIIDQLEQAGIVGPFEGSKAREVKIANEMALEQFLRDLKLK